MLKLKEFSATKKAQPETELRNLRVLSHLPIAGAFFICVVSLFVPFLVCIHTLVYTNPGRISISMPNCDKNNVKRGACGDQENKKEHYPLGK